MSAPWNRSPYLFTITYRDPAGRPGTLLRRGDDMLAGALSRTDPKRLEYRPIPQVESGDRWVDERGNTFTVTGCEVRYNPPPPAGPAQTVAPPVPPPAPPPPAPPPRVAVQPQPVEPPTYRDTQRALGGPDPLTSNWDELKGYLAATPTSPPLPTSPKPVEGPRWPHTPPPPVTPAGRWLAAYLTAIRHQLDRMERTMAVQQSDLDALAQGLTDIDTALGQAVTTLTADDSAIATELAALQAQAQQQGVTLDLSGAQSALEQVASDIQSNLGGAVAATTALLPAPTPPATPSPAVAPTPNPAPFDPAPVDPNAPTS